MKTYHKNKPCKKHVNTIKTIYIRFYHFDMSVNFDTDVWFLICSYVFGYNTCKERQYNDFTVLYMFIHERTRQYMLKQSVCNDDVEFMYDDTCYSSVVRMRINKIHRSMRLTFDRSVYMTTYVSEKKYLTEISYTEKVFKKMIKTMLMNTLKRFEETTHYIEYVLLDMDDHNNNDYYTCSNNHYYYQSCNDSYNYYKKKLNSMIIMYNNLEEDISQTMFVIHEDMYDYMNKIYMHMLTTCHALTIRYSEYNT